MEQICRDALLAEYDRLHKGAPGKARGLIVQAPTIEPKRGKWVEDDHILVCSECEGVAMQRVYYNLTHNATDIQMVKTPYCPHCGAKMERSENND